MNPLGKALMAYHLGRQDTFFIIKRDDGFVESVPARIFFDSNSFPALENRALDLCKGTVLDIGAGAGRHTLELKRRGFDVWSLDSLPETQVILQERGAPHPITGDIFSWSGGPFDTGLILMNGIGLAGTPNRLEGFLRHAHTLIQAGGQILCDSIDVSVTQREEHVSYRERNRVQGLSLGQQKFTIEYENLKSEPFNWLHLDFATLSEHCLNTNWKCLLIEQEPDGHYLARMERQ